MREVAAIEFQGPIRLCEAVLCCGAPKRIQVKVLEVNLTSNCNVLMGSAESMVDGLLEEVIATNGE